MSRVGFGTMQLPGPGVSGPPRDRDAALAVLRRAVELGVNHIDTAQAYGPDVANELMPVLEECYARGIAFVPFFPLGSAFGPGNAVLGSPQWSRRHSGSVTPCRKLHWPGC